MLLADNNLIVNDVRLLRGLSRACEDNSTAKNVLQNYSLGRKKHDIETLRPELKTRYGMDSFDVISMSGLNILIRLTNIQIRDFLPETTAEFLENIRIGRAADGCPDSISELLIPVRTTDDEADPQEVLELIEKLPEGLVKSLTKAYSYTALHFFEERQISCQLDPESILDRSVAAINVRFKKRSYNLIPNNVFDVVRDRSAGRAITAKLRYTDIFLISHHAGISPHWLLGLDNTQALLTSDGYRDTLFDLYTLMGPSQKKMFLEILNKCSQELVKTRERKMCA